MNRVLSTFLAVFLSLTIATARSACQEAPAVHPSRENVSVAAERHDCSPHSISNIATDLTLYSEQREIELGNTLAREVESCSTVFVDPVVEDYLMRITVKMALSSGVHLPRYILVLRDPEINAHSVPGRIYINTGLFLAAKSEAELAGAIAHELGHLADHDTVYSLLRLQRGLPLLSFKRSSEFEADRLATQYMYSAGYDALAFANLIDKAESESRSSEGPATSLEEENDMHPPVGERTRRIRDSALKSLRRKAQYVRDIKEFNEIKLQLMLKLAHEHP